MVASQGLPGDHFNQHGQKEPVHKVAMDVHRLELNFFQVIVHPLEDSLRSVFGFSNQILSIDKTF